MKIKDVPVGSIFNIGNTPTYPKLKLGKGYVDMRDEIENKEADSAQWEVTIMTVEQIAKQFEELVTDMEEWIESLKRGYL